LGGYVGTRYDVFSSFLTQPEINKVRVLYYIDSFEMDWDPETEIEDRHWHVRYARRKPGKNTYRPDVAPMTTKGFVCLANSSVKAVGTFGSSTK
jgi:hypothetical protein